MMFIEIIKEIAHFVKYNSFGKTMPVTSQQIHPELGYK
jgi:hypothetical protein